MAWTTTDPSPTPEATRFTDPERTSPNQQAIDMKGDAPSRIFFTFRHENQALDLLPRPRSAMSGVYTTVYTVPPVYTVDPYSK
jgi:hypothetical protein